MVSACIKLCKLFPIDIQVGQGKRESRRWRAARAATMQDVHLPMRSFELKNRTQVNEIKKLKLITAIKTPYLPDGRFDLEAYDSLLNMQIVNGVEGVIVGGTTGEGQLMSWDEHIMLIGHTVNCFGDAIKVIGNTGSNSTREAIHATEQGFAVGMHAALHINPYYGKTSHEGLVLHFRSVLSMGPTIIYNVPGRTGQDIPPLVIKKLAENQNFAGVKECVGNDRINEYTDNGMAVWSGNDDQCHDARWNHGARGVISVTSNLVPGLMHDLMFNGKDEALNKMLLPLMDWLFCEPNPIALNTALAQLGVVSGLPPPPPSAFSNANIDGEPTNSNGLGKHEPLGVDINKRGKKMGAGIIVVVSLSSAIGAVICVGAVWITVLKCKNRSRPTSAVVEPTIGSSVKRSGVGGGSILSGSMASSTSMSFASSMVPYTGSAKTLTIAELERATDRFNPQNILGEGGFGRVYPGVLEDGTKVAVKVLTRDDQQGGREFIAEVEMLSRLHHRNLVKLIGICTEEHNRSLVYELIPNGSVESHLHGVDKETAPLDWDARIKIALGAARGLAYLHEDSSPRVIHRDFKASNILLEDDFTPKVSDFGLAKSASDEVSGHISTRVMGTFGYVAPEYAMTGHLLVKSDVYSYGVVLLELLTGRKPVDMSQPPGQENLVTWARPLLTSKEGLEALVDPALGNNLPFDNIARVAAIASMCVQPEVSHRPFMGEVVQALKLVYNDSDASNGGGSSSFSHGGESNAHDIEVKDGSSQQWPQSIQYVPDDSSFVTIDYDSGPLQTQGLETERPLSASALLSTSGSSLRQLSGSFRRHSSSGPLRTNKSKKSWYGIRGLAGGSISEHGVKRHEDVHELWP